MNANSFLTLTIKYLDGHSELFEIPHLIQDPLAAGNLVKLMEKRIGQNNLSLELGDRVKIIPMHTVRYIEISPVPEKLPDTVIRNVRQLDKNFSENKNVLDIQ